MRPDEAKAYAWFLSAAHRGSATAMTNLGSAFRGPKRLTGAEAAAWQRRASDFYL